MTGEMTYIEQDGTDSNGETWDVHAAIAKAVDGELHPFDAYQGPYILGNGFKLWVFSEDGELGTVFNERNGKRQDFFPMQDCDAAVLAASEVI